VFAPGETVCARIYAEDTTYYCADNVQDTTYCFFVEPDFGCLVHPNPFTPTMDGINEFAIFDYPYMLSEGADLKIYDMRNILVYERHIDAVTDPLYFIDRSWEGKDNSNQKLPEGLYIWLIVKNGEVVCNGTVVIAR